MGGGSPAASAHSATAARGQSTLAWFAVILPSDRRLYAAQIEVGSLFAPNQIGLVLKTYRHTIPSQLCSHRPKLPKTLIIAEDYHRADEIVHKQCRDRYDALERIGRVLAALVGVMQQTVRLASGPDSHEETIGDELRGHLRLHCPANHAPGEHIDDGGNVEPSFGGPDCRRSWRSTSGSVRPLQKRD